MLSCSVKLNGAILFQTISVHTSVISHLREFLSAIGIYVHICKIFLLYPVYANIFAAFSSVCHRLFKITSEIPYYCSRFLNLVNFYKCFRYNFSIFFLNVLTEKFSSNMKTNHSLLFVLIPPWISCK